MESKINITVIGSGYVGLVTGVCFASKGHQVLCVDNNMNKVTQMKNGKIPIFEPGLDSIFIDAINKKNLKFTTSLEEGVKHAKVIFLALPTPEDEEGTPDLRVFKDVVNQIGQYFNDYKLIVNKSTIPVGTTDEVIQILKQTAANRFDVISNPEFLREGFAVKDFMNPERVIVGSYSDKATKIMRELYEDFLNNSKNNFLIMDPRSSELSKYVANSFLAMKISFMNEIANLCTDINVDIDYIRKAIGSDSRIGNKFLFPGLGYGGSCFPKDVKGLLAYADSQNNKLSILDAVARVNELQKNIFNQKLKTILNELEHKKIAIWGLSFKPNTDDTREAPSFSLINFLLKENSNVFVYDPQAMSNTQSIYGDSIVYGTDQYEILQDAQALIICTEWDCFKEADLQRVYEKLSGKIIFDGRNILDPISVNKKGFTYYSIGRNIII